MCGRYASSRRAAELGTHFGVDEVAEEELVRTWNVAPTDPVPCILQRADRRLLRVVRWGLVPSWAKDPKGGARLINARSETLHDKPVFRSAYAKRRCLLPADGYYEWQRDGTGKQAWYLTSTDGSPLAMAGLYEVWRGPEDRWLWTCAVITTAAADDTGQIHDRTPLLVDRADWAAWLDPERPDPGELRLRAATPGTLDAWRVGPAVGNVRNDGPHLVEPL